MFRLFFSVGHCHPKIINTYQQQLASLGTGQVSTTPDHVLYNIQIHAAEREQSSPVQSLEAESSTNTIQPENASLKTQSRLMNRLLETLDLPDQLQTALTFTSG